LGVWLWFGCLQLQQHQHSLLPGAAAGQHQQQQLAQQLV
jgi:hypothetical protein